MEFGIVISVGKRGGIYVYRGFTYIPVGLLYKSIGINLLFVFIRVSWLSKGG